MLDTTLLTPPQSLCLSSQPLHSEFLNIILPPQLSPACQVLLLMAVKHPQPSRCKRTRTQHGFGRRRRRKGPPSGLGQQGWGKEEGGGLAAGGKRKGEEGAERVAGWGRGSLE